MNYLTLLAILALFYYLSTFENKSILFLFIIIGLYIYREGLLPDTFWILPNPVYKQKFEFRKLDNLIVEYNSSTLEESNILRQLVQDEINTIYFSFPNHLHPYLDEYMYKHYGFKK